MNSTRKNSIFFTLCTSCVGLALLSTAINTALAPMSAELGVSAATGQWLVSGYALALAVVMPTTAFLVTRFPARVLYLGALALFVVASVLCALSASFPLVMAARVVQAMANSLIANVTQVTILSIFPEGERGARMGWFGLATGVAPVVAPALGGFVSDVFGWRFIFWGIAVWMLIALVVSCVVIRFSLDTSEKRFDMTSFVLSVCAFGGVSLGVGQISIAGITAPITLTSLLIGTVAAICFARRQLHLEEPFLDVRILQNGRFRASVVGSCVLYAVMMGSAAVLPLYMIGCLNTSASLAGFVVLPAAACMAAINPIAGKIYDKYGIRALVFVSGALLVASNVGMCIPALNESLAFLFASTILRYLGIGLLQMPLMTWGNSALQRVHLAQRTALITSFRNAFGAIGVAVFVGLFDSYGVGIAYAGMAFASCLLFTLRLRSSQ